MLFLITLYYLEYCYTLPYIFFFSSVWTFFIKSNFMSVKTKTLSNDKIMPTSIIKKLHYSIFIKWGFVQLFVLLISFTFIKGSSLAFLWNQLYLSNFNMNLITLMLIFLILLMLVCLNLTTNTVNYNTDYFFALVNISIFLIFMFFSNNLLAFTFVLELNSITIFYKFVTSKYWYKAKQTIEDQVFELNNRAIPKNYLNMLFFQYWSTFFSSILLFFSLSNVFLYYGSSEFFLIQFLSFVKLNSQDLNTTFMVLLWLPLLLGFFIKMGLTPFHLFKIEVYKGLPLISILFYTTLFFFVYFMFFVILWTHYLPFLKLVLSVYLYVIIFIGGAYIMSLLFDVTALKSFFAYSTIINSLLFLTATFLL